MRAKSFCCHLQRASKAAQEDADAAPVPRGASARCQQRSAQGAGDGYHTSCGFPVLLGPLRLSLGQQRALLHSQAPSPRSYAAPSASTAAPPSSPAAARRELRAARLLPSREGICAKHRDAVFTAMLLALTSLKYPDMDPFKQSATSRPSCSRAEQGSERVSEHVAHHGSRKCRDSPADFKLSLTGNGHGDHRQLLQCLAKPLVSPAYFGALQHFTSLRTHFPCSLP